MPLSRNARLGTKVCIKYEAVVTPCSIVHPTGFLANSNPASASVAFYSHASGHVLACDFYIA
jgi:hypothetical protein